MKPIIPTPAAAAPSKPTKVTFQKPTSQPSSLQTTHTPVIGTFNMPSDASAAGGGAQSKSSGNQTRFPSSLSNQNGMSDHVTSSQSHDSASNSESANEEARTDQQENLANTKEKTPMCLINELARFNRVTHQYTLVDEQGPAHKKTFFVKLQIGDREEYSASGASIKKAQHEAAAIALEKTEFKHPPPKPRRQNGEEQLEILGDGTSVTPTVELNALAMKRGEPAVYRNIENGPHHMYYPPNYDFRGMYNQRYHYMRPPRTFYVSLKVGTREFIGEGMSRQMARHNAAKKALEILRNLSLPYGADMSCTTGNKNNNSNSNNNNSSADVDTDTGVEGEDDGTKSEISVVHEIALRHNLPVTFDVVRESGPPHMKNFITQCIVGSYKTESEGNSKKLSKKRAAEMMLRELKNLPMPQVIVQQRPKAKPLVNKKKNRNLIKQMQKADPTYGVGINPISRLIQIQQAQKKKEPVYSLVAERGLPRRREFVMQVQVEEHTCTGVGPNKKLAKRHAAEAMLQLLGYNKPSPQPTKPAIKMTGDSNLSEKKVTFSDNPDEQSTVVMNGGRQMVPGLIILPESKRSSYTNLRNSAAQYTGPPPVAAPASSKGQYSLRPELKLCELCARHKIEVKFDEFSGANNTNEYLSRLLIATNPPQTLHGSGVTPEVARDAAALAALKIMADMLKEDSPVNNVTATGDGVQIKLEL